VLLLIKQQLHKTSQKNLEIPNSDIEFGISFLYICFLFLFMLKIGLTGGIGTGKSTVAKIFKILGIPVFDADTAAKDLMNNNEELKQKIREEFGDESYENGGLNRSYLAEIVFNDKYKLEKLNALVHPIAIQAGIDWATKQNAKYIIKEAALMFEAGSAFDVDYIIGVFAPVDLRIARVMYRDGITKEQVEARMKNQIDENIKIKLCDFIVGNDENSLLTNQIINIHKKISFLTQ
jgi:dephospho-CoA kinase